MRRPPFRRVVLVCGVALAIAWISWVALSINRRPADGAADPTALAASYQVALQDNDIGMLRRLLFEPPDGTPERLIERSRCGGGPAGVRAVGDTALELTGPGGESCGRLPIASENGRWFVHPWATVVP